jgi:hypothetical protein
MRKIFFFGSVGFVCLLSTVDGMGEGLYRGSNGRMTFISGVESDDNQLEFERNKNLRITEILKEICEDIGIRDALFLEGISDPFELCELLRKFLVNNKAQTSDQSISIREALSDGEQLISDAVIIDSMEEHGAGTIPISESMIKDVLDALQQCKESFQRKEKEESLEKKDLELRERELALRKERLSWEREMAEKEWAWKKKLYIREFVKLEQK